jgi:hypothetical protein
MGDDALTILAGIITIGSAIFLATVVFPTIVRLILV